MLSPNRIFMTCICWRTKSSFPEFNLQLTKMPRPKGNVRGIQIYPPVLHWKMACTLGLVHHHAAICVLLNIDSDLWGQQCWNRKYLQPGWYYRNVHIEKMEFYNRICRILRGGKCDGLYSNDTVWTDEILIEYIFFKISLRYLKMSKISTISYLYYSAVMILVLI